jgi:integrase
MASTYKRTDSPYIWIRYKDAGGKWKSANTGYRQDNIGDRKQAEQLAKRKSLEEMSNKPVRISSHRWEDWVMPWIDERWGNRTNRTALLYTNYFWRWKQYFEDIEITHPATLRREHVTGYLEWRKKRGGERNTAIHEIKFLGTLMDEAINRGYATTNPARKLHIKKTAPAEKVPWSEFEVEQVGTALDERDKFNWMHVTFLMGLYQAARLRQSEIPLSCIDFRRRIIAYPAAKVKGGKAYSQPIDPRFFPILQELVAQRQATSPLLCEIPLLASVEWRRFLDELGLKHLCHHGLRATWITRAALAGIPESLAKRFVNHASSQVHAIYQKITARDLMPMLDAFALYRDKQAIMPPSDAQTHVVAFQ